MSTLQSERTDSKVRFITTARDIYIDTINFLSHLSARYGRLIAQKTADLAGDVLTHSERANAIFPKGEPNVTLRKSHILEARAALNALDVQLTYCCLILEKNPQGAFVSETTGKPLNADTAKDKISRLKVRLGNLVNTEKKLLEGQLEMLTK